MRLIEELRTAMARIAQKHGSFTHPEVLKVSQQLDVLLVDVQVHLSQNMHQVHKSEKLVPFSKLKSALRTAVSFG